MHASRELQAQAGSSRHQQQQAGAGSPVQYMKTDAGMEVVSRGSATATMRIPFFIFLRISGVWLMCRGAVQRGRGEARQGGG